MVDPDALGVSHVEPPYAYRCPFGSDGRRASAASVRRRPSAERIDQLRRRPRRGGHRRTQRRHQRHRRARQLLAGACAQHTRQRGVSLIADEVMSGFGRCGEWFAWQRHGEAGRPDVMTLAKGLTGAMLPLGAVDRLARRSPRASSDQVLGTGLTYCGHPLACAAGRRRARRLSRRGPDRTLAPPRAAAARPSCRRWRARHAVIGDVRGGHGLFAVLELVRDRATREPLAPWPQTPPALAALLQRRAGRGRLVRRARQPAAARAAAGHRRSATSTAPWRCSTACSSRHFPA